MIQGGRAAAAAGHLKPVDQEFLEDLAVSLLSVQPPKMKVDTMSENVLAIFHWPGDSEEMRQRYDAVLHHVVDISAARPLVHLAYSVDDGFQVVDVWSNEDMLPQDGRQSTVSRVIGRARVRTCPDRHPGGAPARVAGFRNMPMYR